MEIYVEVFVLNNLVIDYVLLYATCAIVQKKVHYFRIAGASLLGLGVAFGLLYVTNTYLALALKLISGVLLVLLSLGKSRHPIVGMLVFLGCNFVLAGGIIAGYTLLGKSDVMGEIFLLQNSVHLGITVGGVFLVFLLVQAIVIYIKQRKNVCKMLIDIQLVSGQNEWKTTALYDTGNQLYTKRRQPVVFVAPEVYRKLFAIDNALEEVCATMDSKLEEVCATTVAGKQTFSTKKIDYILVYCDGQPHKIEGIAVAVSESLANEQEFQVILHSSMKTQANGGVKCFKD